MLYYLPNGYNRILRKPFEDLGGAAHAAVDTPPQPYGSRLPNGCCRILLKPFEDLAGAAHADAGSLPQRYGNRFPNKKTH